MTTQNTSSQNQSPYDTLLTLKGIQTGDSSELDQLRLQALNESNLAPAEAYRNDVKEAFSLRDEDFPRLLFKNQEPGSRGQLYKFSFRPKELTIVAAENGSGKSMLTGQFALQLIKQGMHVCIGSYEMPPAQTLKRMIRQMLCSIDHKDINLDTDTERIEHWYATLKYDLILCNQVGHVDAAFVFKMMENSIKAFNSNFFLIDPLTNCVNSEEDFSEVRHFVQSLKKFADQHNVHICLVHHMRKQITANMNNYDMFADLDKSNIRGTSAIADAADNIFTMTRNKAKIRSHLTTGSSDDSKPDLVLSLSKNRLGTWEGYIPLWFDRYSLCFCETNERELIDMWKDEKPIEAPKR